MNGQYNIGDAILTNWKLKRLIGEGSYGRVYEAEREDFGRVYKAAMKIITIPQSQSEIKSIMADGMDEASVTAYFRGFVEELVEEFSLMARLKGNSNVVSYEDHDVVKHNAGIGWDIIIRMELLTPLLDHVSEKTMTRRDVLQLGIDMCRALELCQKYNIIHRDIKPENIFVSENGAYKLGDFGIARTVEKTTGGLSKKGTYTYMAPEIFRGGEYGSGVDIYSLGLVLYRMLNENRTPFLPAYPTPIKHNDKEEALRMRFGGAKLPMPKNADERLAGIVLKSCAFNPKARYPTPMRMREELESVAHARHETEMTSPQVFEPTAKPIDFANTSVQRQEIPPVQSAEQTQHDRTTGLLGPVVAHELTESIYHSSPPPVLPIGPAVDNKGFPPPPERNVQPPNSAVHGSGYARGYGSLGNEPVNLPVFDEQKNKNRMVIIAASIAAVLVVAIAAVVLVLANSFKSPRPNPGGGGTPPPQPSEDVQTYADGLELTLVLDNLGVVDGTYTGDMIDGLPDGYGVFVSRSEGEVGWTYSGDWKRGQKEGQGAVEWEDGEVHEGEYIANMPNGRGMRMLPDGQIYEGDWINGLPNGNGMLIWPDGERYIGEFKDGVRHGSGVQISPGGERLEGIWENDDFTG